MFLRHVAMFSEYNLVKLVRTHKKAGLCISTSNMAVCEYLMTQNPPTRNKHTLNSHTSNRPINTQKQSTDH